MAYDGSLNFDTKINTSGFAAGTTKIDSMATKLTGTMRKLGAMIGLAFAVKQLVSFGREAISLASDLQEVQNVVDTAFGDMSYKMEKFADTCLETYGISKLTAKDMGSVFMAMGKGIGQAADIASDKAIEMTGRMADIMSFYNKTASEVNTIGRAVYSGETEPLKQIGIIMTETNLNTYSLAKGYEQLYKDMSAQQKLLIRQEYFLEQTSMAAGDFVKTQGSWANQTRILSERWKEFKTTIGGVLINLFNPAVKLLNNLLKTATEKTTALVNSMSKLFGWETEVASGSAAASEAIDDYADSVSEASKEVDKSLAPFDDLNQISEASSFDGGDGSTGGVTSGSGAISKKKEEVVVDSKLAEAISNIKEAAGPAADAVKRLWDEGLSKFVSFTWNGLKSCYENFLLPIGVWVLGENGIPKLVNAFLDGFEAVDWQSLNTSIDNFWKAIEPFAQAVGTGFVDFLSDVAYYTGQGIASLINGVGDALNWINGNLDSTDSTTIEDAGKALGTFFGAFVALKAGGVVASWIGTVGKNLKSFFSRLADSKLGSLTIASGFVIGLGALIDSISKVDMTDLDEKGAVLTDAIRNIREAIDNAQTMMSDTDNNEEYIKFTVDAFFELANKDHLTEAERTQLELYKSTLIQAFGEDSEISRLLKTHAEDYSAIEGEIRKMITAELDYIRTKAAEEMLIEQTRKIFEAEKALAESEESLATARNNLNKSMNSNDFLGWADSGFIKALDWLGLPASGMIEGFGVQLYATETSEISEQIEKIDEMKGLLADLYKTRDEIITWGSDTAADSTSSVAQENVDGLKLQYNTLKEEYEKVKKDMPASMEQTLKDIHEKVVAGDKTAYDDMKTFGAQLTKGYKQGDKVLVAGETSIGGFSQLIDDNVDAIYASGKKISSYLSDGVVDGLEEEAPAVQKAIERLSTGSIKRPIMKELQINSPSKVFREFGGYIVKGLVNGITGDTGLAKKTIESFGTDIIESYAGSISNLQAMPMPVIASGAVIPTGAAARINKDQKVELSLQPDLLEQVVSAIYDKMMSNQDEKSIELHLHLYEEGKSRFESVIKYEKENYNRTGKSVFVH